MYGCPNCGTRHEGKYCPECGTKRQDEKSCPNCGAIQENNVKFCTECGYAFPSGADRAVTQPVFPPSKGLYYSAIKEKGKITAYSVMKGVCTDQKITVAAEYNGKPVVAVSDSAFEGCSHLRHPAGQCEGDRKLCFLRLYFADFRQNRQPDQNRRPRCVLRLRVLDGFLFSGYVIRNRRPRFLGLRRIETIIPFFRNQKNRQRSLFRMPCSCGNLSSRKYHRDRKQCVYCLQRSETDRCGSG